MHFGPDGGDDGGKRRHRQRIVLGFLMHALQVLAHSGKRCAVVGAYLVGLDRMSDADPVDEPAGIGLGQCGAGGLGGLRGARPHIGDPGPSGQPLCGRQPDPQLRVDISAAHAFARPDRTVASQGVQPA
jgi:hypothetical protein